MLSLRKTDMTHPNTFLKQCQELINRALADITELSQHSAELKRDNESLQTTIQELRDSKVTKAEMDELRHSYEVVRDQTTEQSREIENLQAALDNKEDEIRRLRIELADMKDNRFKFQKYINELKKLVGLETCPYWKSLIFIMRKNRKIGSWAIRHGSLICTDACWRGLVNGTYYHESPEEAVKFYIEKIMDSKEKPDVTFVFADSGPEDAVDHEIDKVPRAGIFRKEPCQSRDDRLRKENGLLRKMLGDHYSDDEIDENLFCLAQGLKGNDHDTLDT